MCRVYGYARISRKEQSIERQLRNIEKAFPDALMIQEAYTGTKIEGRTQLEKLLRTVKAGDTIVFDSVSRMSRNAAEGVALYEQLYQRGVNLVFLKEPGINTETYKRAMTDGGIPMTGTNVDFILEGVNRYMMALARDQVKLAFEQAQKEVDDLHQRTREGIETARLAGKQIGQQEGRKLHVKKADEAKAVIMKHSKDFTGTLADGDVMKLAGISRNSYYKYKRELAAEVNQ